MSTVAQQLRQAREAQNLTINQVAEITKVRTDHIRALEEGNFDAFSAPVYIRGFTRTYATLLKLDVRQIISALEAELKDTDKFSEPPPLTDQPRTALDFVMLQLSKVSWNRKALGWIAAGVIVVIVLIVAMSRRSKASDPLQGLKPGVYQPQTNSGDTLPLPQRR